MRRNNLGDSNQDNLIFEPLINVDQAAQLLKITKSTLYTWVHQRKVPFRKHGKKLVFSTRDLSDWSIQREVKPLETLSWFKNELDNKNKNQLNPPTSSLKNKLEIGRAKSPKP